jgi:hypothetical protein
MRNVEIPVFAFDELCEAAQKTAINELRDTAYSIACDDDWLEINTAIADIEAEAGVKCRISSSSQGFYLRGADQEYEDYETPDEEQFLAFQKRMENYQTLSPFGDLAKKIITEADFDDRRSYPSNVGWLICQFCQKCEDNMLAYLEDSYVKEFILGNDYEFLSTGKRYKLNY